MRFTVITVIFASVAFVGALFALPIDVLVGNWLLFDRGGSDSGGLDGTAIYTIRYVGTRFAVTEILVLAVTLSLVWAFLRPLGGTESFTEVWQNHSRGTKATGSGPTCGSDGKDGAVMRVIHSINEGFVRAYDRIGNGAADIVRRHQRG
ncbi:hypothetical protein ANO14919_006250 [Xylariales sp. No.14919]|nr:hypothetical protein ANO14919_006250 [Xylariales sp. No.14919]